MPIRAVKSALLVWKNSVESCVVPDIFVAFSLLFLPREVEFFFDSSLHGCMQNFHAKI